MAARRLPEWQGAGCDDINHLFGTGLFQCPREFVQRGAGRHNVIDDHNGFSGKRLPAAKSAADVASPVCKR